MNNNQSSSQSSSSIKFEDKWKYVNSVGQGSTCSILLVEELRSNSKQALKVYNSNIDPAFINKEVDLVSGLSHPRILQAVGFFEEVEFVQENSSQSDELITLPTLALEYAPNGDLVDFLQQFAYLPEVLARTYFHQMVGAVEYIHARNIYHLDIKPDNILLDENFCLKLADFGYSLRLAPDTQLDALMGTSMYHAPEMHKRQPYAGHQADMFALGMLLFMLYGGCLPFGAAKSSDPFYNLIIEGKFDKFWKVHESLKGGKKQFYSDDFRSLIESMLAYDAEKRINIKDIKSHPWFRGLILSDDKVKSYIKSLVSQQGNQQQ